jgi:hypothetical protein
METVKTQKATAKSHAKKTTTATATKSEAAKAKDQVRAIFSPTAESRIKKIENFQKLAERHGLLTAKRDELESYQVSSDDLNEKVSIVNGSVSFVVSNSSVINKVKDLINAELERLIEVSEQEIVTYDI